MSQSARVLSVETLAEFRGFLVKFGEGVRHGLANGDSEVRDTLRWLGDEHPARLAAKVKRALELALDELRRKRLQPTATGAPASVVYEQKVVARAKAKVEWLDDKVAATRRWGRQFQREADQYRGSTQPAHAVADSLVPRSLQRLEGHLRALADYTRREAEDRRPTESTSAGQTSVARGGAEPLTEASESEPPAEDSPHNESENPS